MMKKTLLFLLVFISLNTSAQYISPFFTTMPNDLLPYLSQNNRKDLIDLKKSGKTPKVENLLKGTSRLNVLKDDFISLQLSENSSAELKLLPTSDSTQIIAFVKTVCGGACDSRIAFYTTTWKMLDAVSILPKITVVDFVNDPSNEELIDALSIGFIAYSFDNEKRQLTVTLDAKNWLNKSDFEKFSHAIRDTIILKWINGKFEKE